MGETRGADERRIDQLESKLESLEQRLQQLEAAVKTGGISRSAQDASDGDEPALEPEEQPSADVEPAAASRSGTSDVEPRASSSLAIRIAVGSFALVGALLLRTATRQHLVGAELGTVLGLAYCALLMFGPLLVDRSLGQRWPHTPTLQISGALLAPVILLEMVGRHAAISPAAASAALAVVGATVALLAWSRESWGLAATLVALVGGVAGLGARVDGALPRALVLVEIGAAALWLAHSRGWYLLRPLVLVPASLLLTIAVVLTANRPEYASMALPLALSQLAVLGLVLVNTALRVRELGRVEKVLTPLLLLWTLGVLMLVAPRASALVGSAVAGLLLVSAAALPADRSWSESATSAATLCGALLAGVTLPLVERTGLALGAAALVTQFLGSRRSATLGTVLAQLLALGATVSGVVRGRLLFAAADGVAAAGVWVGLGLALAVLLCATYALGLRPRAGDGGTDEARVARTRARQSWFLAPALAAAALCAYGALQLAVSVFVRGPQPLGVARGALLALLAVGLLVYGRLQDITVSAYLGIAGVALLLGKVVAFDLVYLEGGYVIASVLILAVAATATSIVLKRTVAPGADGGATRDGDEGGEDGEAD